MKQPRKTKTGNFATITDGALYYEDVRQCGLSDYFAGEILDDPYLTAIRVVSLSSNWYVKAHLGSGIFHDEHIDVEMTLRKERRGALDHWYAYRRVFGRLHKRYVGTSERLTEQRLVDIANVLPCVPKSIKS